MKINWGWNGIDSLKHKWRETWHLRSLAAPVEAQKTTTTMAIVKHRNNKPLSSSFAFPPHDWFYFNFNRGDETKRFGALYGFNDPLLFFSLVVESLLDEMSDRTRRSVSSSMQNHAPNTLNSQHTKNYSRYVIRWGWGSALIHELRFALKQKPLNLKDFRMPLIQTPSRVKPLRFSRKFRN